MRKKVREIPMAEQAGDTVRLAALRAWLKLPLRCPLASQAVGRTASETRIAELLMQDLDVAAICETLGEDEGPVLVTIRRLLA